MLHRICGTAVTMTVSLQNSIEASQSPIIPYTSWHSGLPPVLREFPQMMKGYRRLLNTQY